MKKVIFAILLMCGVATSLQAQAFLNTLPKTNMSLSLPSSIASDSQVIYQSSGMALGNSGLTYDGSGALSVGGSVRIGSPSAAGSNRLTLRQSTESSGNGFAIFNSANSTSLRMYVDSDGGHKMSVGTSPRIVFDTNSRVGVLTSAPSATLHVGASGTLILQPQGSAPITCNSTAKGALAMTSTTTELCFCNATSWLQVDSGSACSW